MATNIAFVELICRTWFIWRQSASLTERCADAAVNSIGITWQKYTALLIMRFADAPLKISDLSYLLSRNINSTSTIVKRMIKKGLVKKIRDRQDQRVVYLSMTRLGKETFEQASILAWRSLKDFMSDFSEEELQILLSMVIKVRLQAYKQLAEENPLLSLEEVTKQKIFKYFAHIDSAEIASHTSTKP